MRIHFIKMHGAGNDFVVVEDFEDRIPRNDRAFMRTLANRPAGIGCEGIILLRRDAEADFRMSFFNPDGSAADMCGNGARCAALAAHTLGRAPREMLMATGAGLLPARIVSDNLVRISMPGPWTRRYDVKVCVAGKTTSGHFVLCGVPHFVVPVGDCRTVDVLTLGAELRNAPEFEPEGANVDFVSPCPEKNAWRMRTFERGVEAETGACGTGAMASALVLHEKLDTPFPVTLLCSGGYPLKIDRESGATGCDSRPLELEGPVAVVFRGGIDLAFDDTAGKTP